MVVDTTIQQKTDRRLHALADATRRDILKRCLHHESSVSALAAHYTMSFAAVQKHVAVLERAELVSKRRRGREQLVRGEQAILHEVLASLELFETVWRERLDRFDDVLAEKMREGAP